MKTRSGWVSNSSSSSFICVGFKRSLANSFFEGKLNENNSIYEIIDETPYETFDGGSIIGETLARFSSEDSISNNNFSIEEIYSKAKEIAEFFNIDPDDIKVYFGEEYC